MLYNMMLAYMLVNRHIEGLISVKIIVLVLSMHFIVLNAYFIEVYNELFKTHVRWFAILGLIIGGVLAKTLTVPDYILDDTCQKMKGCAMIGFW
jgi:hypothetical protein